MELVWGKLYNILQLYIIISQYVLFEHRHYKMLTLWSRKEETRNKQKSISNIVYSYMFLVCSVDFLLHGEFQCFFNISKESVLNYSEIQ